MVHLLSPEGWPPQDPRGVPEFLTSKVPAVLVLLRLDAGVHLNACVVPEALRMRPRVLSKNARMSRSILGDLLALPVGRF